MASRIVRSNLQNANYSSEERFDGDPSKFEGYFNSLKEKMEKSKCAHVLNSSYFLLNDPIAEKNQIELHESNRRILSFDHYKYLKESVKAYNVQQNDLSEKALVLLGVIKGTW